ncbi:MAG: bifunctional UDP-3-O-[3-hydroxymyristoyl] N-acetylglucosamine deacetylase/3-hydroxyacyl-ACP dehydratase [Bacteroidetes bacterium]|nr:bifunctional UDP-3-O-[3-hydroxymyristoyl] N-acetylglucosamine deacetylase/3-hydroxyacyl-ACP dehydratase [Bacteroidota bacterium]
MKTMKQRTVKESVTLTGPGLHTGQNVSITFNPAPDGHGYKFRRIDLENSPVIEADADLVVDTSRGTTLEKNGVRVSTVEHVLASLSGMGIDNALIDLDGEETPILDGSARYYVEALEKAGFVEQSFDREYLVLDETITYTNNSRKTEMIAVPDNDFRVSTMIDYETRVLGTQFASIQSIGQFKDEISSCRTFVFLHELEYLVNNNLVKGGDLNNAIVFVNRPIPKDELQRLATFFNKPDVEVLQEGILNNIDLRYPNEPARHKLLDVVGDLALVGKPMKAHIIATRPGHSTNVEFAKMIKKYLKKKSQISAVPHFDPNQAPLLDINAIKKILPHRPPFLLIDKIISMDDSGVTGLKNVTMNEAFFVGHFPNEPVMPGVLQIEAMAQVGGIYVLRTVPDPENYITYFLKIENARFRHKVVPGDTLLFRLRLLSPVRRGICEMEGKAYVGNKLVMEAQLMAQISKK